MRRRGLRRFAPVLVVLLVVLLLGLSVASGWIVVAHFQNDATAISRLYAGVFAGLNDPRDGAAVDALLRLGEQVRRVGIPLVVTDTAGRVTAAANLPFDAAPDDPRVRLFAAELDRENPPITEPSLGTLHYGPVPTKRQLTALSILQALILLTIVGVGLAAGHAFDHGELASLLLQQPRDAVRCTCRVRSRASCSTPCHRPCVRLSRRRPHQPRPPRRYGQASARWRG